ncbi:MAG: DUF805 domain-containing protein [Nitrospira sp.]|nr:DUF805 domain-containing protein [Nitrospira sp.]
MIDHQADTRNDSPTVHWNRVGGAILGTTTILGGLYLEQVAWDQPNAIGKITVGVLALVCMGWGLSLFYRMIEQIRFERSGITVPLGQVDENLFSRTLRLGSGLFLVVTGLQWTYLNVAPPQGTPPHMDVPLLVTGTYLLFLVPIHTAIRWSVASLWAIPQVRAGLMLIRQVAWWLTAPALIVLAPYVSFSGRISRETFWRQVGFLYAVAVLGNVVQIFAPFNLWGSNDPPINLLETLFNRFVDSLSLFIVSTIPTQIKRLHDQNQTGWLALCNIPFIVAPMTTPATFIPALPIVFFLSVGLLSSLGLTKGTDGFNRYGPNPPTEPLQGSKLVQAVSLLLVSLLGAASALCLFQPSAFVLVKMMYVVPALSLLVVLAVILDATVAIWKSDCFHWRILHDSSQRHDQ